MRTEPRQLRRGFRWPAVRYSVYRGAELVGHRRRFAAALELARHEDGDRVSKVDVRWPLRELRRWAGDELALALVRYARRLH